MSPEQHRAEGIDARARHQATVIDVEASTVTVRDLDAGRESAVHYGELPIASGASGISPRWPGLHGLVSLLSVDVARCAPAKERGVGQPAEAAFQSGFAMENSA